MTPAIDLVERLRGAAAAVEAADLSPELRSAGLVLAFWAGDQPSSPEQMSETSREPVGLAAALGVEPEALESIFDFETDDVALIVPRRALTAAKRTAMMEVTHLVVAVRQKLGLADWTPVERVREACHERGVFDRNFGAIIQRANGSGFRVRGTGATRELKMNAAGFDTTVALINRISSALP
jgi:hypothetical protein